MTEEEKEAIGRIKYNDISKPLACGDLTICNIEDLNIVLNLIQKQQEEIEKLKNKNKDLLRKLRNRIKEVKKLTKYSTYKEEFSRLNARIQRKNRQIDLMAEHIEKGCDFDSRIQTKEQIKQKFAEQAKEVEE